MLTPHRRKWRGEYEEEERGGGNGEGGNGEEETVMRKGEDERGRRKGGGRNGEKERVRRKGGGDGEVEMGWREKLLVPRWVLNRYCFRGEIRLMRLCFSP